MCWGLLCFKSIQWCYRLICCFLGPKIAYLGTEVFVEILQAPCKLLGFLPWAGEIIEKHYTERMFDPILFGIISYNVESHTFLNFGKRESRLEGRKVETWYRAVERCRRADRDGDPLARHTVRKALKELVEYENSLDKRKSKG